MSDSVCIVWWGGGFVSVSVSVCRGLSHFLSLRAESQVFALFMLFFCAILHTMWSGKSMQLLCILPFGIFCHQNDVCKNYIGSVYVGGCGGLRKIGHKLCPGDHGGSVLIAIPASFQDIVKYTSAKTSNYKP